MTDDLSKYEALAARAEAGDLPVPETGRTLRGAEAAAQGAADLMAATETDTPEAAAAAATMGTAGRPRVGTKARGASPALSFRLDPAAHRALLQLAAETGQATPTVLREAVDQYLRAHGRAPRAEG